MATSWRKFLSVAGNEHVPVVCRFRYRYRSAQKAEQEQKGKGQGKAKIGRRIARRPDGTEEVTYFTMTDLTDKGKTGKGKGSGTTLAMADKSGAVTSHYPSSSSRARANETDSEREIRETFNNFAAAAQEELGERAEGE